MESSIRLLEYDMIVKISILLALLLALLVVNIYLKISRKKNFIISGIHIASFFGGMFLFCLLIEISILDLPSDIFYRQAGIWAMIFCIAALLVTARAYLINRNSATNMLVSPDLSTVFLAIEDIAVICDYNGNIIETNQSPHEKKFFGENGTTIEDLLSFLLSNTDQSNHEALISGLRNPKRLHRFEIHLTGSDDYYLVTVSPIMADKINFIGSTIVFHDIKEEKMLLAEINHQHQLLQNANAKLTEYVKMANVLEAEKERLKLLQNIQADLIVKIENVSANIQSILNTENHSLKDYQNKIAKVAKQLRKIYMDIRKSINRISGRKGAEDGDQSIDCG